MSTQSFAIKKCLLKPSEGSSLTEEYNLLGGNPTITYMESLLSPAIAVTVTFFDTSAVVSRFGLSGGEFLEIQIDCGEPSLGSFEITSEHKMIINGVRDVMTGPQGQLATLEAIPVELMINETAKISKKFSGNISESVVDIMTTDEKGIMTTKKIDEESTANKYSFVGNFKRPMDIVQWLQPKASVEVEGGESYGFLFYENLDGYHFQSIDTLLAKEAAEGDKYPKLELPIEVYSKILDDRVDTNIDTVMSLRKGMYANKTIYVDLESQVKTVDDFKVSDLGSLEKLPLLPQGLEEKPTKLMFRITDPGALQKDSKKVEGDESALEKQQDLAKVQNKSYSRNSLLFSSFVEISVPFNPKLRVGNTIEIQLPMTEDPNKTTDRRTVGNDSTPDASGKYLISELKHIVGNGECETQLSLVRDTFTVK